MSKTGKPKSSKYKKLTSDELSDKHLKSFKLQCVEGGPYHYQTLMKIARRLPNFPFRQLNDPKTEFKGSKTLYLCELVQQYLLGHNLPLPSELKPLTPSPSSYHNENHIYINSQSAEKQQPHEKKKGKGKSAKAHNENHIHINIPVAAPPSHHPHTLTSEHKAYIQGNVLTDKQKVIQTALNTRVTSDVFHDVQEHTKLLENHIKSLEKEKNISTEERKQLMGELKDVHVSQKTAQRLYEVALQKQEEMAQKYNKQVALIEDLNQRLQSNQRTMQANNQQLDTLTNTIQRLTQQVQNNHFQQQQQQSQQQQQQNSSSVRGEQELIRKLNQNVAKREELEQKMDRQQRMIDEQKQDLFSRTMKLGHLETSVEVLNREKAAQEQKIVNLNATLVDTARELQNLKRGSKRDQEDLEKTIKTMMEREDKAQQDFVHSQKQNKRLEEQIQTLQTEWDKRRQQLSSELQQAESTRENLQKRYDRLNQRADVDLTNYVHRSDYDEVIRERAANRNDVNSLHAEIERLRAEMKEFPSFSKSNSRLHVNNQGLTKERVKELLATESLLTEEQNRLHALIEEKQQFEQRVQAIQTGTEEAKAETLKWIKESKDLSKQLKNKENALTKLETKLREQSQKASLAEIGTEKKAQIEEALHTIEVERDLTKQEIVELREEKEISELQIQELQAQIAAQTIQNKQTRKNYDTELQKREDIINKLQTQLRRAPTPPFVPDPAILLQLQAAERKLQEEQKENNRNVLELKKLNKDIKALQKKGETGQLNEAKLQSQLSTKENRIVELENIRQQHVTIVQNLKEHIQQLEKNRGGGGVVTVNPNPELQNQIQILQEQNRQQNTSIQNLQLSLATQASQHQTLISTLNNDKTKLLQEIATLQANDKKQHDELKQFNLQLQTYTQKVRETEAKLETESKSHSETTRLLNELKVNFDNLSQQANLAARTAATELETVRRQYEIRLANLQTEWRILGEQKEELETKIEEIPVLTQNLAEALERLRLLKATSDIDMGVDEELERKIESLNEKIAKDSITLGNVTAKYNALIESTTKESTRQQTEANKLSAKIVKLEEQIGAQKAKYATLEATSSDNIRNLQAAQRNEIAHVREAFQRSVAESRRQGQEEKTAEFQASLQASAETVARLTDTLTRLQRYQTFLESTLASIEALKADTNLDTFFRTTINNSNAAAKALLEGKDLLDNEIAILWNQWNLFKQYRPLIEHLISSNIDIQHLLAAADSIARGGGIERQPQVVIRNEIDLVGMQQEEEKEISNMTTDLNVADMGDVEYEPPPSVPRTNIRDSTATNLSQNTELRRGTRERTPAHGVVNEHGQAIHGHPLSRYNNK
jgi:chromosome segregation ATPase